MSTHPCHVAIVHLVPIWRVCSTPTRRTDRDGARSGAIRLPTWTTRCEDRRDVVPAIHETAKRKLDRHTDHDDLRRVVDQIKTLTEDADRALNRLRRIVEQPTGAPAGDSESDLQ